MKEFGLHALLHGAFYRFVPLADPAAAAESIRACACACDLKGSIVVAAEGISGTVAGRPQDVVAFESALQQGDLLNGVFHGMRFRHSACTTEPFGRLKVGVKPEIVALALPAQQAPGAMPPPDERDASHLGPSAWRELLARKHVVLLDNRNHFEYRLGHFNGAIDPGVHNFRDFVTYVEQNAPQWRASARPVAMYCTGGIRCDKTAPWLRELGLEVWQLEGGILNYFDMVDDANRDWQGECFVFDNRMALDCDLNETPTTAEQVFDAQFVDEAWRLRRARQLDK